MKIGRKYKTIQADNDNDAIAKATRKFCDEDNKKVSIHHSYEED